MTKPRALVRQWTLLRVLSQHADGLSIDEMAKQTAVHSRTIRRDLNLFVDAGIPLRQTARRRNKKIWRIDPHGIKVLTHDATDECMALLVTEYLFQSLEGSPFLSAIARCRSRLAGTLRLPVRKLLEDEAARLKSCNEHTLAWSMGADIVESLWARLALGCKSAGPLMHVSDGASIDGFCNTPRSPSGNRLDANSASRHLR